MNNFIYLLFFLPILSIGQNDSIRTQETSDFEDFDFIFSKIIENQENDSLLKVYLNLYLKNAKRKNLFYESSYGYYLQGITSNYPKSITYFDSVIHIATEKNDHRFLPQAYLEYGNAFFQNGMYSESFKKYDKAKTYSDSLNNEEIFYAANINIAFLKEITNDYQGALEIYLENKKILNNSSIQSIDSDKEILSNYQAIAYAHLNLENLDSTTFYTKIGYNRATLSGNTYYQSIFNLVEGINLYKKENYEAASHRINNSFSGLKAARDHLNLAFYNLFIGKIKLKINDTLSAKKYFIKADSLLKWEKRKIPILSEVYMHLWELSQKSKNTDEELVFLTKYLDYEKSIKHEYKDLYPLIKKKYDIPKLINAKEIIIQDLDDKNKYKSKFLLMGYILILIIIVVLIIQYLKIKKYRKSFNELISNTNVTYESIQMEPVKKGIDIASEIIDDVLLKLTLFEKKQEFLDSTLNLKSLADQLETNSSYLSKIINHYKGKGFSKYLAELRINYIVNELLLNQKLSDYTIKAIANEAGFNNAESFSKAFKEKTKIYPSYFIKQLNKEKV